MKSLKFEEVMSSTLPPRIPLIIAIQFLKPFEILILLTINIIYHVIAQVKKLMDIKLK